MQVDWKRISRAAAGVAMLAVATGCSDNGTEPDPADPAPTTGVVRVALLHEVGDVIARRATTLELGTTQYQSPAGNTYTVSKLQYVLSNVRVHGPDGSAHAHGAQLVDAAHHDSHTIEIHGVEPTHYHQLVFTFGLSEEDNVTDAHPDLAELAWPEAMGGGYHYMKLEGDVQNSSGTWVPFLTHTGRLDDGTVHPHFFEVALDIHSNVVAGHTLEVELIADLNEWYSDPHTIDLESHTSPIMGNTDAQNELEENGASVFRIGEIANTDGHDHDDHDHDGHE